MSDWIIEKDGVQYVKCSALFEMEINPLILAPFYGVGVPVMVRRLSYAQIRACGEFSLIETVQDIIAKKENSASTQQMLDYARKQHALVEKSLVSPTYEEVMKINEQDCMRVNAEKEIGEIREIIAELPNGPKKTKLRKDCDMLEIQTKYYLPADFISFVTAYALGMDHSDIRDVTEDGLYEAACLAKMGSDNPSDHFPGEFTDFNKVDIDNRAWIIFNERQQEKGVKSGRSAGRR